MKQTLLLARAFFGRFFESELMPPGLPQVQLVIWSMALLAAPGLLLPMRFAAKYLTLRSNRQALAEALLVDRLLFITLTMTTLGIVALVIWDGMFPDRRDARILTVLPVRGRVLVAARLLAIAALAGIFLAGVNLAPTLFYGTQIAGYGAATNLVRGVMAHLVATTLAGAFVFSLLVALQGAVLNLGGRRASERLSVLLQVFFVVALLQMIFFMPRMRALLPGDLSTVWSDPWLRWIPSIWFLGLYDVLGGRPAAEAIGLARYALLGSGVSIVGAVGLFVLTHHRLTRLALESVQTDSHRSRAIVRVTQALSRHICPNPVARSTFEFTLRTLTRSRSHRLLLAMYVGAALALVASAIVPVAIRDGLASFTEPGVEILSAPLVLGFLSLVGLRVAFAIPVEPRASWVVKLHEPDDRVAAINGVRAAMMVAAVLPSVAVAAGSASILWGARPALVHATVCALMAWALVEILLMRLVKIPFTCTYYPGTSRFGTLWPLYLSAFITYAYSTAAFELLLIERPRRLVSFGLISLAVIFALTERRRQRLSGLQCFRFDEEDPDTMFTGFQLSEGLAARTEAIAVRLRDEPLSGPNTLPADRRL
jgi:hypothetical protein